jgi:hypothetical protein
VCLRPAEETTPRGHRPDDPDLEVELSAELINAVPGEEPLGAVSTRGDAVPGVVPSLSLDEHGSTARRVAVDRRVQHDDRPVRAEHPERLAQGDLVAVGVVERGVEDDEIDLPTGERQAVELGADRFEPDGG